MATWSLLSGRSAKAVQATTEAAPSTSSEGVLLEQVGGFTVIAEADVGQTFTGAGDLYGFVWDDLVGWCRNPEIDLAIPSTANGQRRVSFSGFTVANPRGRVAHVCNAAGVSSGGVTLYYACTTLRGGSA